MKTYIIQNKGKGQLNVQPKDLVKISSSFNSIQPVGNYIALTGTEDGKPLTGNIELDGNSDIVIKQQAETYKEIRFWGNDSIIEIANYQENNINAKLLLNSATIGLAYQDPTNLDTKNINLVLEGGGLKLYHENANNIRGIYSNYYFGANYDDNTYVQKKYVDDKFTTLTLQQATVNGNAISNNDIDVSRNITTAAYLFSAYSDNATTAKWGQFVVYQEADGYLNVYSALRSTNPATPSISTYYGWQALQSFPKAATTTSTRLTAYGYRAGRQLTSGNNNNFFGGAAGTNIVSGSGNTIIGSYNFPANTTLNNSVVISDGSNTRIVFQTSDTGLTTVPAQTTTNYAADTTGKAIVTKEVLNASFTRNQDVEITDAAKGIILKSPNGTRFRLTVGNNGVLAATAI